MKAYSKYYEKVESSWKFITGPEFENFLLFLGDDFMLIGQISLGLFRFVNHTDDFALHFGNQEPCSSKLGIKILLNVEG